MNYFAMGSPAERAGTVHRLARSGYSDDDIAAVTGLSAEQVREILDEQHSIKEPRP